MRKRTLYALALVAALCCDRAEPRSSLAAATTPIPWISLDQGWSDDEKDQFWFTAQGSWLVPYRWFVALENAKGETLLRDTTLEALGFLPARASARNPDGLPIGFVKDREKQGEHEMLGLTCAACHTTRIEWGGKTVQVEGGPTAADYQGFLDALVASLEATARDPRKLERFASRVAGKGSVGKATALQADLESFTAGLAARKNRNDPPHPYGRARVDALGIILNEVLAHDLGVPENVRPSDAPVSYPVIWDAHQLDFVQWNGSAPNVGPGPTLRNIGQVLGVFGHMRFAPRPDHVPVYQDSSVDVANLEQIEVLVAKLRSPVWPAGFPAIDGEKARAGRALYATQCQRCHAIIERADPGRRIEARMVPLTQVGTDPVAGTNFVERQANTGPLKGTPVFVDLRETFGDVAGAADLLRNAVFGVLLGKSAGAEQRVPDEATALQALVAGKPRQLTVAMYKARPLDGVWASAPYLHNGSVPTLWEMLKRPAERAKSFFVGSRQYDPMDVGFMSVAEEGGVRYFAFDVTVRANSNAGHPYGTQLEDEEKRQLLEYLKTL